MSSQNFLFKFSVIFLAFSLSGCGSFREAVKVAWGSSTKALEEARAHGIKKTFDCPIDDCFSAVTKYAGIETKEDAVNTLLLAEDVEKKAEPDSVMSETTYVPVKKKNLDIFLKDERRKLLIVMGVPDSIPTTEVGIFFTSEEGKGTNIEVSSLSTAAKVKAADMIFSDLIKTFKEIN